MHLNEDTTNCREILLKGISFQKKDVPALLTDWGKLQTSYLFHERIDRGKGSSEAVRRT